MRNSSDHTDKTGHSRKLDDAVLNAAFRRMTGVMDRRIVETEPSDDPVFVAAAEVAGEMGFSIPNLPYDTNCSNVEKLKQIARIGGFRTRNVLLEGEWWKSDCGILFAFTQNDEPVSLLKRKSGSYIMKNTVTGEVSAVNRQVADTLDPLAVTFYKPFPSKPLKFMDIYRMTVKENRSDFLSIAVIGTIGGLIGVVTPMVSGVIFDDIIPSAERSRLFDFILILFCLAFVNALFGITKGLCSVRIQSRINNTVQSALWDRLLALPVPFFRSYTSGELASNSLGINGIIQALSGVTMNAILSTIFSIFYLFLLFYYNAGMAVIAILMSLLTVLISAGIGMYKVKRQGESVIADNKSAGFLFQVMFGISKIRITGAYKRAFGKYSLLFTEKKTADIRMGGAENIVVTINAMIPIITSMVLYGWMSVKVENVTTGQFIAFLSAFSSFQTSLLSMTESVMTSLKVVPLYKNMQPIIETMPEFDEVKGIPDGIRGGISVSQVSFRYSADSPQILSDVSIEAKHGEFVAIVGGSGSGKSTLLRLLLGFEKPESGTVFYDDHDLDTLDVLEVRRQLGVVLQNDVLIQGSIMENIVGQSGRLTINDAWYAAEMAGIAEDIKQMPMGMHTMIPAGGSGISGGQKQRLIIARALVKKPALLLFDEATSALDNKTQAEVSRNIEALQVTRIVIAHRLSTIRNADRIYVLEKGRIVQCGTFDELMARDGLFLKLSRRQIA